MSDRDTEQVIARIFDSEMKNFARFLATPDDKISKGTGLLTFRATTDPSEEFADNCLGKTDIELRSYEDPETHVKETIFRTEKTFIVKRVRSLTDSGRVTDIVYQKYTPESFREEYPNSK